MLMVWSAWISAGESSKYWKIATILANQTVWVCAGALQPSDQSPPYWGINIYVHILIGDCLFKCWYKLHFSSETLGYWKCSILSQILVWRYFFIDTMDNLLYGLSDFSACVEEISRLWNRVITVHMNIWCASRALSSLRPLVSFFRFVCLKSLIHFYSNAVLTGWSILLSSPTYSRFSYWCDDIYYALTGMPSAFVERVELCPRSCHERFNCDCLWITWSYGLANVSTCTSGSEVLHYHILVFCSYCLVC